MIFDHTLFEHYIQRQKSVNKPIPVLVTIGYQLFKNRAFVAVLDIFEYILLLILTLPIPVYRSLVLSFITHLPGTPRFLGLYLRGIYYRGKLKSLGKNVIIEEGVRIISPQDIEIGDGCIIDKGVVLAAGRPKSYGHKILKGGTGGNEGQLTIGRKVQIAPYATIGAAGGMTIGEATGIGPHCSVYSYTHVSMDPFVAYHQPMDIGSNVAIGTNSSVICVSKIPDSTYIKPNTFLKGSFLNNEPGIKAKK